jgi:hypothetical protein
VTTVTRITQTTKVIRSTTGTRVITKGIQGAPGSGGGGGGGGVTDHGSLTGLGDDDHSQYHNDARGDVRYYTKTAADTLLAGKVSGSGTSSGTNTGDQTITLTGDVTGSGTGSFAATIAAGAVTLAKLANMATGSLFYRKTAGSGAPEVQTLATLKTDLGLTGTNSGDQTITLTGDVTGSGTGSFAATIAAASVTLAKMANMATGSLFYRKTAGSGAPEVQTLATLKTDLGLTGTNSGDQTIALTGDVTGSGTGSFAATIANAAVTLAKMADMATGSLFYRKTAGSGVPEVQTLATLKTDLGLTGTNSGDQTITLTGDVTGSGTGSFAATIAAGAVTLAKLANMASGSLFYRKTAGSGAPEVQTLATLKTDLGLTGTNSGDQTIILTGDVTGSGTGSFAATIAAGSVTNSKLATVATATFKGRTTAGTGAPEDLTATQATALLDVFGTSAKGLAPASGGGTTNFLRADGSWAAPGGGGGGMAIGDSITSATAGSVLFAGASGVLQQDNANLFWDDTNNCLGIGTATPNAAALLDLRSTTKGLQLPSMTNTQRDAVSSPPEGLIVYDNVFKQPMFRGQYSTWYFLYVPFVTASYFDSANLAFAEQGVNGSNKTTVRAQDSLAADNTVTLPSQTGTVALAPSTYTVATLPTSYTNRREFVSDANATTLGTVVAGGGSNRVPVNYDGTNWRIG